MKTSTIAVAVLALGLASLLSTDCLAQSGPSRPLVRPRPTAVPSLPGFKSPAVAQRPPVGGSNLAPALPDLILNSQAVTGAATLQGIKYRIPVTLRVRNQGAAKSGAFTVGVRYAQPAGAANPPLQAFTGFAPFLKGDGTTHVVQQLNPGQEVTLLGYVYLPQSLSGELVRFRGKADVGGSPEHAQPWGSVKETNENNNWSAELSAQLP